MTEPVLAGVAESDLGETPDRNWLKNAVIATTRVLNDAGCTLNGLNGLNGVAIASGNDYMSAMLLSEYLGLDHLSILAGTEIGRSSFEAFCGDVAAHMALGDIDVVAVAYGSTSKTDPGRDRSCKLTNPTERFVRPTGLFTPSGAYAMACRQHMHEYGTTEERLAEVAVATRKWASMNPMAAHVWCVRTVANSNPPTSRARALERCINTEFVMFRASPDSPTERRTS